MAATLVQAFRQLFRSLTWAGPRNFNVKVLHEKEAEGNSHAVILMKNGNQLLEAQSQHAFIMSIQHNTYYDLFCIDKAEQ